MNKKCTTCLKLLPISNFYKKGNRHESVCKECKKKKRSATYVTKRNSKKLESIIALVEVMIESDLEHLSKLENKIDKILIKSKSYDKRNAA